MCHLVLSKVKIENSPFYFLLSVMCFFGLFSCFCKYLFFRFFVFLKINVFFTFPLEMTRLGMLIVVQCKL